MIRWVLRCSLLIGGFALTSFGLLQWQDEGIGIAGVWPFGGSLSEPADTRHAWPRPLQDVVLGVVVISLSLWQIPFHPPDSNDEP